MAPPTQPQQSILVVEDSAEIRNVWQRLLAAAGFLVIEAADGAEGVRKAQQYRPDLVLMDLNLPVLDGISAIEQLKSNITTASVPVIVLSGDVRGAARAHAAGCEMFLAKPVRVRQLLNAIATTLDRTMGPAAGPELSGAGREK